MTFRDTEQKIQEHEYDFPYHHLVEIGPFSETRHLFWGYRYAAYVEKVLETLRDMQFESLIDIGCGDGKVLREIADAHPDARLVGVDYSEKSLRFAKAFSPHLDFRSKIDEQFDVFVCIEVMEHIPPKDMKSFVSSLSQYLKPGGYGIITTPCDSAPVPKKHYQHFNRRSFEEALDGKFEIRQFEYISADNLTSWIVQRLLANRFFILNWEPAIRALFWAYKKRCLQATTQSATQIFAVVRKSDS